MLKHLLLDSKVLFDDKAAVERAKRNALSKMGRKVDESCLKNLKCLNESEKKAFNAHFNPMFPNFFLKIMALPVDSAKGFLESFSSRVEISAVSFENGEVYSQLLKSSAFDKFLKFHFFEKQKSSKNELLETALKHLKLQRDEVLLVSKYPSSLVKTLVFKGSDFNRLEQRISKLVV